MSSTIIFDFGVNFLATRWRRRRRVSARMHRYSNRRSACLITQQCLSSSDHSDRLTCQTIDRAAHVHFNFRGVFLCVFLSYVSCTAAQLGVREADWCLARFFSVFGNFAYLTTCLFGRTNPTGYIWLVDCLIDSLLELIMTFTTDRVTNEWLLIPLLVW